MYVGCLCVCIWTDIAPINIDFFFLSIFNIFIRPFCILGQVIVRIIYNYLFSCYFLSPFQVYALSDPKSRSCLWSLFVVAALICGAYFIGSAFVAKDYEDVLSSTQSLLFKFTTYKDVMLICQYLNLIVWEYIPYLKNSYVEWNILR